MPMPANPPRNPASPFASFGGHHVGVRVPDFDAALAWYTEKLDFRVLQQWPYGDLKLACLSPADDDQHFCLHVEDVDKARAELAARGVDLVGEPFEIDDISRRLAFFRDPWGNMIELSQPFPGAAA